MKVAAYWHVGPEGRIHCELCPQHCVLKDGHDGLCHVRGARDGQLIALGYGKVSSLQMDPIEKKPLYHFFPGAPIFSVGGWGCNLACSFCQNWSISQQGVPSTGTAHTPESIVAAAARAAIGIAYTYNEPLVGYEFVDAIAALAHRRGLKNVLVTNGQINAGPAAALLPLIDALNIDIKSTRPAFYRDYCSGDLNATLRFAEQAYAAGCHVELTTLVIPGLNDSDDDFVRLADWVRDALGPEVPLHLSAYRPCYEMDGPATSVQTLERGWTFCAGKLDYVYIGNVATARGCDTRCPGCQSIWIERRGFRARTTGLDDGRCASCGRPAPIIRS